MAEQLTTQLRPAARRGNRFTSQEQAELRSLYPRAPWTDLLAAVPGRERRHIIAWAAHQGIARETAQARAAQKQAVPKAPAKIGRPKKVETPVLDARVSTRTKSNGPTQIGRMLEQMQKLPGGHPRRLAYAQAARTGNGLDAYEAFMNWKPGKETAP